MRKTFSLLLVVILVLSVAPSAFSTYRSEGSLVSQGFDYQTRLANREGYAYDSETRSWSWDRAYVETFADADVVIGLKVQGEPDQADPACTYLYVKVADFEGNMLWTVESIEFQLGENVYAYQSLEEKDGLSCAVLGSQGQILLKALEESDGSDAVVRLVADSGKSVDIRLSQSRFTETLKEFARVYLKYNIWAYTADTIAAAKSEELHPLTVNGSIPE